MISVGILSQEYMFLKGRIIAIGIANVIGPKFQKFIAIVIKDEIL
jgi:hypothetical protein